MGAPDVNSSGSQHNSEQFAKVAATQGDEVEWEYEYDDNETEDYYFTLDITTNQPRRTQKSGPPAKRRRLTGPENGTAADGSAVKSTANALDTSAAAAQSDPHGKLQVLDLHTENPLVLLDGNLHSCRWSTDIGTQFYVAKAGTAEKPLRAGRVVDVVGLSRARLVGSPVIARPRPKEKAVASVGATEANAIAVEAEDDQEEENGEEDATAGNDLNEADASLHTELTTAERFAKARREVKGPQAEARISFLERLSAIKEKKGETDQIPISGVKQYELPTNQDEIRKASMAADAERENGERSLPAKNRKRGSYKKKPQSENAVVPTPEQQRQKPGPKTSSEVKSSLGLSNDNG